MSDPLYSTWGNEEEKNSIYNDSYLEGYEGSIHKSVAHGLSNRQTFLDIQPGRSVKPQFTRTDYNAFRPGEAVPQQQKRIMAACMGAYDTVGIIRNVIDLMSDFASQGLTLYHPNKNIEKFYRKWFSQVNGQDRSERFLNLLYRCGNVPIQRRTAKVTSAAEKQIRKAAGADMQIEISKFEKKVIPWQYDFLNPLAVEIDNIGDYTVGRPTFHLNMSKYTQQALMVNSAQNNSAFKTLPKDLQERLSSGERKVPLDPDRTFFYHYKKDDWHIWANPMIYAILDDIFMLEKMKLADLAALDGAISNVRLWTVGNFDHKIVATKAGLDKIKNILASNVGGGTMDLVWGPELSFKESNSQVYKFLGSEKYQPVLTSIYAGLGIPPTLTGASGSGGGYTNNYVSLKTLIERLEYGREILTRFWNQEIEFVRKAMGFRLPAQIHFDSIILSDEAAQKNLLIQLADRDIISQETLVERFGELPSIEKVRTYREVRERDTKSNAPKKASPYHNPNHRDDVAKLGMSNDTLDTEKYMEKVGLPYSEPKVVEPQSGGNPSQQSNVPKKKPGRPIGAKDGQKRPPKRVLPRSGDPTAATIWGISAQEKISEMVTPSICSHFGKRDARGLSKAQVLQLEDLKLSVFASIEPMADITPEIVKAALAANKVPSEEFKTTVKAKQDSFESSNKRTPNSSEMRHIYAASYAELFCFG